MTLVAAIASCLLVAPPGAHHLSRVQMGTAVDITVWHADEAAARQAMDAAFAEIDRIEKLMSEWIPASEVSRANSGAARGPVPVGPETFALLERAQSMSRDSSGAFDVTWAAMRGLWDLRARPFHPPPLARVLAAKERVGWKHLALDPATRSVRFGREGMAIGLGAIAKGYAVDRASAVLSERGMSNHIVGGGGDVIARGSKGATPWRVGIQHPRDRSALLAVAAVRDASLVTSGDYERFAIHDGRRYHHILDPRTGFPAGGAIAVTVLAPNATDADALSTAAFVLGAEEGLKLLEAREGVEGLIVDAGGTIRLTSGASSRLELRVESVRP